MPRFDPVVAAGSGHGDQPDAAAMLVSWLRFEFAGCRGAAFVGGGGNGCDAACTGGEMSDPAGLAGGVADGGT